MLFSLLNFFLAMCMCTGFNNRRIVSRDATLNVHSPRSIYSSCINYPKSFSFSRLLRASSTDQDSSDFPEESKSVLDKVKDWFRSKKVDGLTTKERLAKMGMSALLSYGWVSNMSYAICMSLTWFTFCKQYGITPLTPGQRSKFLAIYSGFFIFNNAVRPIRFGLSIAVSRYFENIMNGFQRFFNVGKGLAIGIVVFLANVLGTLAAMALGIALASVASGIPIFPPKV